VPIGQGVIGSGDSGFEPDSVRILGIYKHVLREWCRAEVCDYPEYAYGPLEFEGDEYRQWEAEVEAVADKLFNEHAGLGERINAWWYWLPKGLPAPLDNLGKGGDGPRHFWVYADDRVSLEPVPASRWSAGGGSGIPPGPQSQ